MFFFFYMVSMPESDHRSRWPDGATDTNELETNKGDDEMRDSKGVLDTWRTRSARAKTTTKNSPHRRPRNTPTQMTKKATNNEPQRCKATNLHLKTM
jgi:hypothetical protein